MIEMRPGGEAVVIKPTSDADIVAPSDQEE